jgi:hypothetical protein
MENRNGGTHASKVEKILVYICTLAYSKGTKYLVSPLVANGLDTYFVGNNIAKTFSNIR